MKGKLLLLNLALAAAVVVVGSRARDNWLEVRKRAAIVLGKRVKPAPAPPFSPLTAPERAVAAAYADVAQQTLFSPDRNPTVVVEVAPPKPMPELPVMYGVLDLGDGAVAIMRAKKDENQQRFHAGEMVGDFKLVSFNSRQVVFEWDGKQITKKLEELRDRAEPAAASEAQAQRAAAPAAAAAPPPAAVTTSASVAAQPGLDLGAGFRACTKGDNSPPGTIANGYKKVVSSSPFGQICRWEQVQ